MPVPVLPNITKIVGFPPKRYRTSTATILAYTNPTPNGTQRVLCKTPLNNYFVVVLDQNPGANDLEPVSVEQAVQLFAQAPNKEVTFAVAFPGVTVEDA